LFIDLMAVFGLTLKSVTDIKRFQPRQQPQELADLLYNRASIPFRNLPFHRP